MASLTDAPVEQQASRRGPMRPRRLVSVRANQSKRLSSHVFRWTDMILLAVITVAVSERVSPVRLWATPLGRVVPFVVGALVVARALRSLLLYRFVRSDRWVVHLGRVTLAVAMAAVAMLATDWLVDDDGPSAASCLAWIGIALATLVVTHTAWWLLVRRWRAAGWLTPNLLVVGATQHAEQLIGDALSRRHVNVLGVFDDRLDRVPASILGVPVLGDVNALLVHKILPFVDRIVIAVEPAATRRAREIAARLSGLPNEVTLFLEPEGAAGRTAALARLGDSPLAELNGAADVDRKAFAKRMQDLVIGVPALLLVSPLLALIAVLVRIDSKGPVFFRQRRHGFNNEEIVVWKFRSMRADAADARAERQVSKNDDRVTRVGRFLRKSSLDELPQLINVVRGEMSLVGPRPHAIGMKTGEVESALLVAEYAHRHRIKPGMTGWAAIKGSRGPLNAPAEVQRRVALDVDYIARQSFWLDLRIIATTLPGLLGDHTTVR
jgi:Undecaprenyl-phosphate glucose phosphotransferase